VSKKAKDVLVLARDDKWSALYPFMISGKSRLIRFLITGSFLATPSSTSCSLFNPSAGRCPSPLSPNGSFAPSTTATRSTSHLVTEVCLLGELPLFNVTLREG
jgi:hypothetical protein